MTNKHDCTPNVPIIIIETIVSTLMVVTAIIIIAAQPFNVTDDVKHIKMVALKATIEDKQYVSRISRSGVETMSYYADISIATNSILVINKTTPDYDSPEQRGFSLRNLDGLDIIALRDGKITELCLYNSVYSGCSIDVTREASGIYMTFVVITAGIAAVISICCSVIPGSDGFYLDSIDVQHERNNPNAGPVTRWLWDDMMMIGLVVLAIAYGIGLKTTAISIGLIFVSVMIKLYVYYVSVSVGKYERGKVIRYLCGVHECK